MSKPANNRDVTANWKKRWENAARELQTTRKENRRLRLALDSLNEEVELVLNMAGQEGNEAAKTWLITTQRQTIRRLRNDTRSSA